MTETDVARVIASVEKAVKAAEISPGYINMAALIGGVESVVNDITLQLEKEGLFYVQNSNECSATARAIVWAAWVSWVWVSKAETRQPPDAQAQQVRPVAEKLLSDAIDFAQKIGKEGRPEEFLNKRGITPP